MNFLNIKVWKMIPLHNGGTGQTFKILSEVERIRPKNYLLKIGEY